MSQHKSGVVTVTKNGKHADSTICFKQKSCSEEITYEELVKQKKQLFDKIFAAEGLRAKAFDAAEFVLKRKLGEGSFGNVFLVHRLPSMSSYALKIQRKDKVMI